jgi:tetratricopeptide (TPR) repeat protein
MIMKYDSCSRLFVRWLGGFAFVLSVSLPQVLAQNSEPPKPSAPQTTQSPKPSATPATAKTLIAQGILQYRRGKYDLAAKQFMAALKLEPNNDEALGYASLTAYQLGNHTQARELFQQRADLPNQKSSVKIFSHYMVALTWWRQAHETIALHGELQLPQTMYEIPEKELTLATESINAGLASLTKVLALKPDYAEAINLRNLLHAEAALVATEEDKVKAERLAALNALRQAIKLSRAGAEGFGAPTILVGEYAATEEEQNQITDPMLSLLDGGKPLTRVVAELPIIKIAPGKAKGSGDQPAPTGVGPGGSAVSVGPGQGALRPSKTEIVQLKGGQAKVEILISPAGKVVFARILAGPPATTGPALEAAKKWTFSPPKFEGHPIQVLGVITFDVKSRGDDKTKLKSVTQPKPTNNAKKN